jgi:hypothetical protein
MEGLASGGTEAEADVFKRERAGEEGASMSLATGTSS